MIELTVFGYLGTNLVGAGVRLLREASLIAPHLFPIETMPEKADNAESSAVA